MTWIDQNGDEQPKTAGGDLPRTVVMPPKPLKPVVQPTWQIGRPKQSPGKDIYVLANGAEGSITNNVVIDADPNYFTFILKKELGDLEGINILRFAGRPTDGGVAFGVDFTVTYEDANGDRRSDHVPAKFEFNYSATRVLVKAAATEPGARPCPCRVGARDRRSVPAGERLPARRPQSFYSTCRCAPSTPKARWTRRMEAERRGIEDNPENRRAVTSSTLTRLQLDRRAPTKKHGDE